jgi:hypothetical protein
MNIKLEHMDTITLDIGRKINIVRYGSGLIISNSDTNQSKEIKWGDLGETIPKEELE